MVSVVCTVYNHDKYLHDTLEGFVKQETDFIFEVIVHDDASTDHSAVIIKEYAENFPEIIHPIYQTENQYSKGVNFFHKFILPKLKGKYIAECEGDDFWTDVHKLQKQVDYLESHLRYIAICGNVHLINEDGSDLIDVPEGYDASYLRNYTNMVEHDFTLDEIKRSIMCGHICTRMYRNIYNCIPSELFHIYMIGKSRNGDQKQSLLLYCIGKVRCVSDVYANHRKSWVNDSYTASTYKNYDYRNEFESGLERQKIADYCGVDIDFWPMCYNASLSETKLCIKTPSREHLLNAIYMFHYVKKPGYFVYLWHRFKNKLCRSAN